MLQSSAQAHSSAEPLVLYGDSTPFPYGAEFLSVVTAVVEGCAAMLQAQVGIDSAVDQLSTLEQRLRVEKHDLAGLVDAIARASAPYANGGAAAELQKAARDVAERERVRLDGEWSAANAGIGRVLDDACTAAYRALERLLSAHILPDSRVSWQLAGDETGYDALVHLATGFGLAADFSAAIPDTHPFARPRRVGELAPGTAAHLARAGEWRRASEPRPLRLDRMFLSEAFFEPQRIVLTLRRGMAEGVGWRFVISGDDDEITAQELAWEARPAGRVEKLGGDDRAAILRLGHVALNATRDLLSRRALMLDARFDGQTLRQRHEPREVCARMLGSLGKIVREIDRRSGAPGELVLRRHIGDGRREAVFVKKAELLGRIASLPPSLARLFSPLGLQPPRR